MTVESTFTLCRVGTTCFSTHPCPPSSQYSFLSYAWSSFTQSIHLFILALPVLLTHLPDELPEYIEYNDAFHRRQLDMLAVYLEAHCPVQVLAHLAAHHLSQAHLHVDTLVTQSGITSMNVTPWLFNTNARRIKLVMETGFVTLSLWMFKSNKCIFILNRAATALLFKLGKEMLKPAKDKNVGVAVGRALIGVGDVELPSF